MIDISTVNLNPTLNSVAMAEKNSALKKSNTVLILIGFFLAGLTTAAILSSYKKKNITNATK